MVISLVVALQDYSICSVTIVMKYANKLILHLLSFFKRSRMLRYNFKLVMFMSLRV
jgi:hypothetical protein